MKTKHQPIKVDSHDARIFVIGDIHGTVAELEIMIDYLKQREDLSVEDYIVFVGDYIDRGYHSKAVVDLLLELKKEYSKTVFLKGNHEDMLLSFLGLDGLHGENFIRNGGAQTLISYGIDPADSLIEILEKLPEEHKEFYKNLGSYVEFDKYFVVHAGMNPLRDITAQTNEDLFWIRDEFIMTKHSFEKTIVFGHTPFKDIFNDWPSKMGIDTGLVYGNILSCVELTQQAVFQVSAGTKEVLIRDFATEEL